MFLKFLTIVVLIQTARSKPQLLTFENGKIGVNFGGYHAEAGLGGLLTGNAAHGGLSASAGTPFGQIAGAGLGGSLDGRTAGGLYAGASAGHGVGASAAIGGGLGADGGHGGIGAESHAGSVSKKVVKLSQTQPEIIKTVTYVDEVPPRVDATYNKEFSSSSTFNAQSSVSSSLNGQTGGNTYNVPSVSQVDTVPPQVYVQKFKKRLHHHNHRFPSHNNVISIEKRFQVPQYQTNTQSQTNIQTGLGQQPAGFDYRNFFDFGFFSNTAAGFGGSQAQQPQISYEQRVVPTVVYEKHIVPQVIVEKTIQQAPVTSTFTKKVQVEKNIESDINATTGVTGDNGNFHGSSHTNFGLSGGYNQQTGSNIINDIFNIPIATLQAVNRLVSNKVAGSHGNFQIQKTFSANQS